MVAFLVSLFIFSSFQVFASAFSIGYDEKSRIEGLFFKFNSLSALREIWSGGESYFSPLTLELELDKVPGWDFLLSPLRKQVNLLLRAGRQVQIGI